MIGEEHKLFYNREIGSGAFGKIYYGQNVLRNEEVAIKIVRIY
jgi:hypothetical protein